MGISIRDRRVRRRREAERTLVQINAAIRLVQLGTARSVLLVNLPDAGRLAPIAIEAARAAGVVVAVERTDRGNGDLRFTAPIRT